MVRLNSPRGGLPELADTPDAIRFAADRLARGLGPVAVDTERASGFRYDDRAFLLQIRRARSGTVLIDPEGHRELITEVLAPVLNPETWVLHAAASDLPSLAMLGLHPAGLFDTELAGRLAGVEKVNLAAMIEEVFGYELAKGHGAEDWSTRPLPTPWLAYAALDVELLLELAEAMAEILDSQNKLGIAHEEFEHLVETHRQPPGPQHWRDLKGVGILRRPEQLAVAKHLFRVRDARARESDTAVGRILPNKVLVEIARALPPTASDLARVRGVPRRAAGFWFSELVDARNSDPATWPRRSERAEIAPHKSTWQSNYPESWDAYQLVRAEVAELAMDIDIPLENVLKPALLRDAVWMLTEEAALSSIDAVGHYLADRGAREWQIAATAPIIWRLGA
ncbi:HRDC domain-containing protein [Corynebacterium guangdongense]|uniref:Ribonuclease D n=1 Tax=Corynebacterium guangdongense TaxID=1783348 RepID=A0ABU1ZX18_9CORY|nr:HRDC domain-containing protein [Corynebacterium guangdongense]MDR7329482.1 ribonuclease D [Corynebacterium guangdongense]WJZ18047.1 Ribonuclease D [Corynebacterium guangdongense]